MGMDAQAYLWYGTPLVDEQRIRDEFTRSANDEHWVERLEGMLSERGLILVHVPERGVAAAKVSHFTDWDYEPALLALEEPDDEHQDLLWAAEVLGLDPSKVRCGWYMTAHYY